MIVTAWYFVALVSFVGGLYLAIAHYQVGFLDGQFDVGAVMFFGGIVMVVIGMLLLGGSKE
jgi:hypothetical protein